MWSPARTAKASSSPTLIGIAGGLPGGFLAPKLFHVADIQEFFSLSTWITAITGAAILLLAYHLVPGQNDS